MKPDKETNKVQAEGEMVSDYVKSDGWRWVRDRFNEKILDLQSIRNISAKTPDELTIEIAARNAAVDILIDIIRLVEGRAEQHNANKGMTIEATEEVITFYQDETK